MTPWLILIQTITIVIFYFEGNKRKRNLLFKMLKLITAKQI